MAEDERRSHDDAVWRGIVYVLWAITLVAGAWVVWLTFQQG